MYKCLTSKTEIRENLFPVVKSKIRIRENVFPRNAKIGNPNKRTVRDSVVVLDSLNVTQAAINNFVARPFW